MSHDGNAGSNDFLYRINDLHAPFQFQSIGVRIFITLIALVTASYSEVW